MTSGAVQDKVIAELKGYEFELIASNLTKDRKSSSWLPSRPSNLANDQG